MQDSRGVTMSTDNQRSADAYERALSALNCYRGDPVAHIDQALAEDPAFAMGHVLRGHAHVSMWERSVLSTVEEIVAKLKALESNCNDRERRHLRALEQWSTGEWNGYRAELDRLLTEYPRDLLALQLGHLADFFHGDRDNLRGRISRALPAWSRDDPGYAFLHGMHAFGLEECGDYSRAEDAGRQAIESEPDDCWAQHALAHVMEMQARQAEGIALMESRTDHWAQDDNGFQFHNWWHTALFNLDQDNVDRTLEIYDRGVRAQPTAMQMTMLDAAALLWRLHLRRIDVGNRWDELADLYESDGEAGFYAFNDMHAIMALAATGRTAAMKSRLEAVEKASTGKNTNAMMTREVGLPIVRAVEAFAREKYGETVDLLMPVRYRAHIFGGSHAQRDIVHRTLLEAAIRAKSSALASALINERTALKPHCPFGWKLHRSVAA